MTDSNVLSVDKLCRKLIIPKLKNKIDETDLKILEILQDNARISQSDLAKKVNLSLSPCHVRLRKLESLGLIKGYKTVIDLGKLLRQSSVFVTLRLEKHQKQDFELFEKHVQKIREVTECFALGGGFDYLLKFTVRDIGHYQSTMDKLLSDFAGVREYYTYIVTGVIKNKDIPIGKLLTDLDDLTA